MVARLLRMQEAWGSNPHISTKSAGSYDPADFLFSPFAVKPDGDEIILRETRFCRLHKPANRPLLKALRRIKPVLPRPYLSLAGTGIPPFTSPAARLQISGPAFLTAKRRQAFLTFPNRLFGGFPALFAVFIFCLYKRRKKNGFRSLINN